MWIINAMQRNQAARDEAIARYCKGENVAVRLALLNIEARILLAASWAWKRALGLGIRFMRSINRTI